MAESGKAKSGSKDEVTVATEVTGTPVGGKDKASTGSKAKSQGQDGKSQDARGADQREGGEQPSEEQNQRADLEAREEKLRVQAQELHEREAASQPATPGGTQYKTSDDGVPRLREDDQAYHQEERGLPAVMAQHTPEENAQADQVRSASNESAALPPSLQSAAIKAHGALAHIEQIAEEDKDKALAEVKKIAAAVKAELEKYLPDSMVAQAESEGQQFIRTTVKG
jgi:hypothetical protein